MEPTNGYTTLTTPPPTRGTAPAFPMFSPVPAEPGISRRGYIATKVLAGLVAGDPEIDHAAAAVEAVAYTDALLVALGEP